MAKPKSMNLKNSTQRIEPHRNTKREVTEIAAEPEAEQETEEEQSHMEVTEADAEPEVNQEEADQMRDTDAGSKPQLPANWASMNRNRRKHWYQRGGNWTKQLE